MTLTELRYVVAVAREKHFGRAAEACFVSQPTLSVSIKKLEEELDVRIFERGANEVSVTPIGEEIVRQAQAVIEQAAQIKEIAKRRKDPLSRAAVARRDLHHRPLPAARAGPPGDRARAADAADAAGELHRQAARACCAPASSTARSWPSRFPTPASRSRRSTTSRSWSRCRRATRWPSARRSAPRS